jgi:hypothetical protein
MHFRSPATAVPARRVSGSPSQPVRPLVLHLGIDQSGHFLELAGGLHAWLTTTLFCPWRRDVLPVGNLTSLSTLRTVSARSFGLPSTSGDRT